MREPPRFPGYDVLAKRDTPSWDPRTRAVIDARLATPRAPRFFDARPWAVADALCRRIVPGEIDPPLVALLDAALLAGDGDGTRDEGMPYRRQAWQVLVGLLDAEAQARHGQGFVEVTDAERDALLTAMQHGEAMRADWQGLNPKTLFERRVLAEIPALFYGLPQAWSEIGFGGPAFPRGYVRLDGDRRDAWEAAEATPGHEADAARENRHVV